MRTVAAGVVLLLAAVSGCSAEDAAPAEVGPLASASATTLASAVPSASSALPPNAEGDAEGQTADSVPSAATAADSAGAAAFARHYIATLQQAVATGDATALDALSDPGCGGCRNLLTAIAAAADAGHHVRGAELTVDFAEAPAVRAGETIVDLRYKRRAGDLVDARGAVVQSIAPEGPIDTQLRLKRVGRTWSVLGFRQAAT